MNSNVIILHDIDGRVYFESIHTLCQDVCGVDPVYRESIVFRRLIAAILKRRNFKNALRIFLDNLWFRISVPFISGKTIVFGMAPYDLRFFWYCLLSRKNRLIYHTSWPYWWTENVPKSYGPLRCLLASAYMRLFRKFDIEFVCVTEPVATQLTKHLPAQAKVHVIPHSINLESFYPQELHTQQVAARGLVHVVFVGRMVKEKGVLELADAIAGLPSSNFQFSFVGDGGLLTVLQERLRDRSNVHFFGKITDKRQVGEILRQHDVLVLPSVRISGWEELFGLVIIEAMATGLLVLSSDHIGPRGIIEDGVDGILIPDTHLVDTIQQHLSDISADVIRYADMRAQAVAAAKKYSTRNVSRQWQEVLFNEQ
jgi:glycosyltransferase involved in cell wall biosynthesis